jgi:AcrR family transcriptional regulator
MSDTAQPRTKAGFPTGARPDRRVSRTQRALKVALTDLILDKGYEAVTVQDIIDRADVGRSTFYAHYVDKDELLLAVFADLEVPAPEPSSWAPDDPPFAWTLQLFRHVGTGKRVLRAVAGTRSGAMARQETERWLDGLARAELDRLGVMRRHEPARIEMVVAFIVGTFIGFLTWWMRDENEELSAETIDAGFRSLVLPGVSSVLGISIGDPESPPRTGLSAPAPA